MHWTYIYNFWNCLPTHRRAIGWRCDDWSRGWNTANDDLDPEVFINADRNRIAILIVQDKITGISIISSRCGQFHRNIDRCIGCGGRNRCRDRCAHLIARRKCNRVSVPGAGTAVFKAPCFCKRCPGSNIRVIRDCDVLKTMTAHFPCTPQAWRSPSVGWMSVMELSGSGKAYWWPARSKSRKEAQA